MRLGRAVSAVGDVLEPDARLLATPRLSGCGPREHLGLRGALAREDGLTFDVDCVSRAACAERACGVDEELLWKFVNGLRHWTTITTTAHLIAGFG